METHILIDKDNPPEDSVWIMLCGTIASVQEDGSLVPPMDFVGPESAHKADCERCLDKHDNMQFDEVNALIRTTLEKSKLGV